MRKKHRVNKNQSAKSRWITILALLFVFLFLRTFNTYGGDGDVSSRMLKTKGKLQPLKGKQMLVKESPLLQSKTNAS